MIKLQFLVKFISKLSKKEKALLYAAVFVGLVVLLDRAIIYPVYAKIRSLHTQIKEKEFTIVKEMRILAMKDKIAGEAKKYSSYAGVALSEEEEITTLLKEIESLANKSSLYVVDMKPAGAKEEKDKSKKFLVSLSCEGQMEQIMDFMYNVENSKSLLSIERYQISPKSRESSVATSSMTISKISLP